MTVSMVLAPPQSTHRGHLCRLEVELSAQPAQVWPQTPHGHLITMSWTRAPGAHLLTVVRRPTRLSCPALLHHGCALSYGPKSPTPWPTPCPLYPHLAEHAHRSPFCHKCWPPSHSQISQAFVERRNGEAAREALLRCGIGNREDRLCTSQLNT